MVRDAGRWIATPLLAVLIVIETTDVVFAVDSIPAIFAVTSDTFLVFTSNAFAILGLRALYFVLAGAMGRFVYLKVGLAVVLVFVGVKMLISEWYHIPIGLSLGFIALTLTVAIVASLRATRDTPADGPDPQPVDPQPVDPQPVDAADEEAPA
jgi:tellurite resistance protein TerC